MDFLKAHILSIVTFLPLAGALLVLLLPRDEHGQLRFAALLTSFIGFAASLPLLTMYDPVQGGLQLKETLSWVPQVGISYSLGVDGIAVILIVLTTFLAPVVLLSHAEALGEGREALDAFPDGNAGDANLAAFLKSNKVPFGVFANIHEAGGRAADLSGKLATEDVPQKSLFVNVGLGDSTPWKLNDGTWSYGLVATLKIDGDQASYKAYRAPQLTDDERTNARALEPASAAVGE